MEATIDRAGRLVVPKPIREAAHLQPGTRVRFQLVDGCVQIEPLPLAVTLERPGGMVVAVPNSEIPALPAESVDETLAAVRSRPNRPQHARSTTEDTG
ncbi:MAG: AbrB/MazE/SpoVT family DNA-binding domain-containing protein [Gammaproteobacteria bacterium]|nr:AbrB/MazE/SpoVT family DNA-binding domain-containing protein [Gammaproteobacteria bacterium]MYK83602.1 AbrB/MazE/SpoVT family DNA-binding domain-containing protein [Gammaproteobacteria bacterium]